MGKTKIQWTESTWNPVVGCSKVSAGCDNCYAERMAYRLACMGQEKYQRVIHTPEADFRDVGTWVGYAYCDESALEIPLHWKKPRRIFVCSMGDLFHESVPFEFIDKVMGTMILSKAQTSRRYSDRFHIYQLLTKRPEIALEYYKSSPWPRISKYLDDKYNWNWGAGKEWYPENVWLGVTAENQEMADKRIPILLQIPAAVRFVSIEPMLEAINFRWRPYAHQATGETYRQYLDRKGSTNEYEALRKLDWVIVGGESGAGRRWCDNKWVRSIAEQCKTAGVPVFVKQLHSVHYNNPTVIKDINQFPEELRIRKYPQIANEKGGE